MGGAARAWVYVACATAVLIGCFSPDEPDGAVSCPTGDCPPGFTCAADGLCYRSPTDAAASDPDAPMSLDASGLDASSSDASGDGSDAIASDAMVPDAEGCGSRDTDPVCGAGGVFLGDVPGDAPGTPQTFSAYDERWLAANILETSSAFDPMTARIELEVPPGVDMDLHVICEACGDSRTLSSTNGPGVMETILIGRSDGGGDRSYSVLIEVRYVSAIACGDWTITLTGNVSTSDRTCN